MKKMLLKGILLICIVFTIHLALDSFFNSARIKDQKRSATISQFLKMPKNSIDVLFLGSSHSYCSLNPQLFKEQLSLEAFNLGSGTQSFANSYYILKEALKSQNPQIVIQDIYSSSYQVALSELNAGVKNFPEFDLKETELYQSFSCSEKMLYGISYLNLEQTLYFMLSSQNPKSETKNIRGFEPSSKKLSAKEVEIITAYQQKALELNKTFEQNLDYLDKIIKLCAENNIKLIFITSPMIIREANSSSIQAFFKTFFKERERTYFDFSVNQLIAFDPEKDFRDESHVNDNGAAKISLFLTDFLRKELTATLPLR